ncbi:hypothetical protein LP421_08440 [Rhizobium sp. RCAM05350]|nr:hypothetical protein LP421_08440 [Rhizobium sp. RCAM05350]
MGYYLANRLLEIKQHLGPVLKELKLATRACCPPDSIRIEFVSPRARAHFSPVMISFEDKKKSGLAEASWQKASVQVAGWECRQLRDSDWVSWKWGEISSHEIKGEGEQMFSGCGLSSTITVSCRT